MTIDSPRDRGPNVQFPPPVLFAGGLAFGILLDRVVPGIIPAKRLVQGAGVALGILGLGVVYAGIATFWRARTAVYPNRPAARIVTHGVYAYTRNPMYLGLTVFYLGVALVVASTGALLLLPVVHFLLRHLVIAREERYLNGAFPHEYAAYSSAVRRWL